MSSPIVRLQKASSTESVTPRHETSQQRISLQHIFNSCVLDKYQRVNAGELIRHFRFVAEQNADSLAIHFDFNFLLNELGGVEQQVTFDQLFSAVEKLYSQLVDKSIISTPTSKSMSISGSASSLKKRRNKENIDFHIGEDVSSNLFDSRKKSNDHEKCKIERNELLETNRRQTESLRMLEEEYKKLEDEHQHLQSQYEEIQKKRITLEDDLNRSTRYKNENIDLRVYKSQLETSYRDLKEENEFCEREKFELQEKLIDMENQLQSIRHERDQYMNKLIDYEHEFTQELTCRQHLEEQISSLQNQLKENEQIIHSLKITVDDLKLANEDAARRNEALEKTLEELRQQLRAAKTESIEARLSLSNLCEEESLLCDELEQRVDVSRRATISNGQSLFAEINTINNISNECVSQYLDSSNMETIDDMEVQILLSKTDSFNSLHLKDVFHELHVNGININENLIMLMSKIQSEEDREYISTTTSLIDKDLLTIKSLIKKIIDNKDVFEGRFRKLQTLLIASREQQRQFQAELNEFTTSAQLDLTTSNVISVLKDYYHTVEELKHKDMLTNEKIRQLEKQLLKIEHSDAIEPFNNGSISNHQENSRTEIKQKQEHCDNNVSSFSNTNHSRRKVSNLTDGICPFHSVRELLRHESDLFNSTSALLPCRCLNRSRSSPTAVQMKSTVNSNRRISTPCQSVQNGMTVTTADSGLNTSTGCTTSRSLTPVLNEDLSVMTFEIDSLFNRTLTKEVSSKMSIENKSLTVKKTQSCRVKRVLKRLQWCAIITSCSIVLFIWSVIMRYYFLTSPNDDDCNRLSFAWWPFAYCSTNGITL